MSDDQKINPPEIYPNPPQLENVPAKKPSRGAKPIVDATKRIYLIEAIAGIFTVSVYVINSLQTEIWQVFATAMNITLGLAILAVSYILYNRGQHYRGKTLSLFALMLAYAGSELFFGNATIYILIGGSILVAAVGRILDLKPRTWITITAINVAFIIIVNIYEPFPRYDITLSPFLNFYVPFITYSLGILFTWQITQVFRIGNIRTRLLISFLLVTLIPLAILAYLNNRGIQRTLTETANQSLYAAASETADSLDEFITSTLNAVASEARIPTLPVFLSLPSAEQANSPQRVGINGLLRALADKDPEFIASYAVLDQNGINVLDTLSFFQKQDESDTEYFRTAFHENQPYVSPVLFYEVTGEPTIFFSSPIIGVDQQPIGVLRVRYSAAILQAVMEQSNGRAGLDSFGILFQEIEGHHLELAHGTNPESLYTTAMPLPEAQVALLQEEGRLPDSDMLYQDRPSLHQDLRDIDRQPFFTAQDTTTGERINQVAAVTLDSQPNWIISFFQPQDVFLTIARQQANSSVVLVFTLSLFVAVAAILIAQLLSTPIARLTVVAQQVAAGDLTAKATVDSEDEISILANTFNSMTGQLQELVGGLEQTVAERTQALERRAQYLEAAAEVGRTAAEFYNLDDLLSTVTHLISERFGFYHVGLLLLDEKKEYAVLRAANSEGGYRMIARGHKLKVGEQGIVGYVTSTGLPRVEQSVEGEGVAYFANPELPLTRSEMALPLEATGNILGALDVQSEEEQAFSEEDVTVLQVLADQVAMAINNTLLFSQVQESLDAERRAYGELSREAWGEMLHARGAIGFSSSQQGLSKIDQNWRINLEPSTGNGQNVEISQPDAEGKQSLKVPVKVRGDVVVGVLETHKPAAAGPWAAEEIAFLEEISNQLGVALENARLYEQTQRLAQRERIASDVSSQLWSSTDVDTILQTAVQELGRALNASQGTIRLDIPNQDQS
ncbi:MAG: GAF domain-containing protein [Anaerolineae bacterium]|nr:GAF domain-containing protein [Anaerolineae bacterium]